MGGIVMTNDGNAILREITVEHPAAKSMIEIARTQDEEVGDGTTSVIILGESGLPETRSGNWRRLVVVVTFVLHSRRIPELDNFFLGLLVNRVHPGRKNVYVLHAYNAPLLVQVGGNQSTILPSKCAVLSFKRDGAGNTGAGNVTNNIHTGGCILLQLVSYWRWRHLSWNNRCTRQSSSARSDRR